MKIINFRKYGFTLVEIMVVVAIIGILSAIVFTAGSAAKRTARDNERHTDIKLLQIKLESYRADHNSLYPTALDQLVPDYIGSALAMPHDPSTGEEYEYTALRFNPEVSGGSCGVSYYLSASLENSTSDLQTPIASSLAPCPHITFALDAGPNIYSVTSPDSFQK